MDETSPATDESKAPVESQALEALLDRPMMKYVGFALLLAWHYTLWFIPDFFFDVQLLDDRVTISWIVNLVATALFLLIIAAALGRKRHLSDCAAALPTATAIAAVGTVTLGFLPFQLVPAAVYYGLSLVIAAAEAILWILWGERYACIKASFTISHIGTVFGLTLLVSVAVAAALPSVLTAPFAALLPLASGVILGFTRSDGRRTFPVLLPRSATNSGLKNMLDVGTVTLFACVACYFLSCIIP